MSLETLKGVKEVFAEEMTEANRNSRNSRNYTASQKRTSVLLSIALANINRFSIFFTVEFGNKFATKRLLHYPPHFKFVATLPCEMTVVTNKDIFILKEYIQLQ